jgi:arsenate reductase (glutaredoxin)
VQPEIVDYEKQGFTREELQGLAKKLQLPLKGLIRTRGAQAAGLDPERLSDDEILEALIKDPNLIQRPIAVRGPRAIVARPPESIDELL